MEIFCLRVWKGSSVDGLGGRVKGLIRDATKSKSDHAPVVKSAMDFAVLAKSLMPRVNIMYVSDYEVSETVEERNPWANAVKAPGVTETHCMVCKRDDLVKLFVDDLKTTLVVKACYGGEVDSESEADEELPVEVNDMCYINVGEWVVVTYDGRNYPLILV